MLSSLVDNSLETEFDVHLIGGFEDVSLQVWPGSSALLENFQYIVSTQWKSNCSWIYWTFLQHANGSTVSESPADLDGYSFPLCLKIVHTLWSREEKFHIRTICVLGHNTRRDSDGNTYPFFNGFVAETTTGIIIPAIFDRTSRCPDEIVRRIRVSVSYEDANWNGKLLETYDSGIDCFKIAPCRWTLRQNHIASSLLNYSDSEILSICSTSPTAEASDFVENLKRQWNYLIEHPHWTETFPKKQPRTFARSSSDGRWIRCWWHSKVA